MMPCVDTWWLLKITFGLLIDGNFLGYPAFYLSSQYDHHFSSETDILINKLNVCERNLLVEAATPARVRNVMHTASNIAVRGPMMLTTMPPSSRGQLYRTSAVSHYS